MAEVTTLHLIRHGQTDANASGRIQGQSESSLSKEGYAQSVRLALFDLLGRRVKTLDEGWREEGEHRIFVNGESLASGRYLYRLETAGGVLSRQLTIVK